MAPIKSNNWFKYVTNSTYGAVQHSDNALSWSCRYMVLIPARSPAILPVIYQSLQQNIGTVP